MNNPERYHKRRKKGQRSHFFRRTKDKENVPPDQAATHQPATTSAVLDLSATLPVTSQASCPGEYPDPPLPAAGEDPCPAMSDLPTTNFFLNLHGT